MKKTKFIVLALVMAVMLLGAGYAYWTQDLTIESTVSTGELAVEFRNLNVDVDEDGYASVARKEISGTDDHKNNKMFIALSKMYPGATADISFEVENTGTMLAVIDNFGVAVDTGNEIPLEQIYVDSVSFNNSGEYNLPANTNLIEFVNYFNTYENIYKDALEIEPTESLKVAFTLEINPDADESDVPENGTSVFTITAEALQYNDPN